MQGLSSLITQLQGVGCSPFFFTSALQSAIFGDKARSQQAEIIGSNLRFKERMQELRDEYSRQRMESQQLFRRECVELGRQYLIQQTMAQNESRKKQIEFRNFISHYWPLNEDVFAVLEMQNSLLKNNAVVPLNVLVAKTEVTSDRRNTAQYEDFCERLRDALQPLLPSVTIEKCPWKNLCQSRIGEAMNVNYVMSGIPTLLVFPYQMGDAVGIEMATWSFNRGIQSISHRKLLKVKGVTAERLADTALTAVKATVGMARDAYMLSEYHLPAVYNAMAKEDVRAVPELNEVVKAHYSEMAQLSRSKEFRQLCLPDETKAIDKSLNNNHLTQA